ncbi:DNA-binding transcriptional regulator YhcF (GntR family) [Clostridium beijerinckii]|nr:DNA-binding transcriptional regulator YhcF (GntR family) [Clostridium beijerinckii]
MLRIDPRSSTPIYEQIELGIKELILKGALKMGEKLPSVRELASILMINPIQ